MLDLKSLKKKLDQALENETKESLTAWLLENKRKTEIIMKAYIVFQTTKTTFDFRKKKHLSLETECGGAYDSLDKAVKQCKNELFWVGVATINEDVPEESVDWGECYNHKGQRINGKGELL